MISKKLALANDPGWLNIGTREDEEESDTLGGEEKVVLAGAEDFRIEGAGAL
jgi:hypothetical protein